MPFLLEILLAENTNDQDEKKGQVVTDLSGLLPNTIYLIGRDPECLFQIPDVVENHLVSRFHAMLFVTENKEYIVRDLTIEEKEFYLNYYKREIKGLPKETVSCCIKKKKTHPTNIDQIMYEFDSIQPQGILLVPGTIVGFSYSIKDIVQKSTAYPQKRYYIQFNLTDNVYSWGAPEPSTQAHLIKPALGVQTAQLAQPKQAKVLTRPAAHTMALPASEEPPQTEFDNIDFEAYKKDLRKK